MRFALDSTPRKLTARKTRANRRQGIAAAALSAIESLESRQMLATVSGGQIGVYQGPDGLPVRIVMSGSGSLTFVGATRDVDGNAQLNDIPMTIFNDRGQVVSENLGGYGGRNGFALANDVFGDGTTRSQFVGPTAPYLTVPSGRVSLDGLAANFRGKEYGVNRYTSGVGSPLIDILRVSPTGGNVAVDSEVSDEVLAQLQNINPLFSKSDLLSVIGADFPPTDANHLYFAVNVNYPTLTGTDSITRKATPAMFIYDTTTQQVTLDPTLFGFNDPVNDEIRIDDFTFLDNGQVAMFGSSKINGATTATVGLFTSDADAIIADPAQSIPVRIGEQAPGEDPPAPSTSLAAIEAIPGTNYILAVTIADPTPGTGNAAELVRFDATTGRGLSLGPVVDPNVPSTVISRRGANIRDLTWNPKIVDSTFQPGKRGGLEGSEGTFDVLLALDIRDRFPNSDLYAIYGNNVTSDTKVAIAAYTPSSDTRLTFNQQQFAGIANPYDGSAGSIKTTELPGLPVDIALPNGALYLGLRTLDENQALTIPVLGLSSKNDFSGTKPTGVSLPKTVRPGIYLNGSINTLLFGGTITGGISIAGSIDTLYAGNIITGDPYGGFDAPTLTSGVAIVNTVDNFFVNGDMRNLIVAGGIGTLAGAPDTFAPKTDLQINGRVQQIKTGLDFRGSIDVVGKNSELSNSDTLPELEARPNNTVQNRVPLAFAAFELVNSVSQNDTFDTEQILGSYYNKNTKKDGKVVVSGSVDNGPDYLDDSDFYGVPLLAGQTIQVTLQANSLAYVAIIDPEGRVYAEDRSNQSARSFINKPIQLTADKPGVWRIRVTAMAPGTRVNVDRPYNLSVSGLGTESLGGLVSTGDVFFDRADLGIRVRSGDFGAIQADGNVEADTITSLRSGRDAITSNPIEATRGNLRAVVGGGISRVVDATIDRRPTFRVPKGSIGLIDGDTWNYFNQNVSGAISQSGASANPSSDATVGGDIQSILSNGDASAYIQANGNIGEIRVASWAATIEDAPGFIGFGVNGKAATLGLIDVTGDFGSDIYGGPEIDNGANGNVKYLRVGGSAFRTPGAGRGGITTLSGANKSVQIEDDSGAMITLTPYDGSAVSSTDSEGSGSSDGSGDPFGGNGEPDSNGSNGIPDPFGGNGTPDSTGSNGIPDPFGGANNPIGTVSTPNTDDIVGTISLSAYPTANGGNIVFDVICTTGLAIATSKKGGGGSGDIGRVRLDTTGQLTGTGAVVGTGVPIIDPSNLADRNLVKPSLLQPLELGSGTTLDIIMTGGPTNVYEIGAIGTTLYNFDRVLNNTDGEIVSMTAGDVGYMSAQRIGVTLPVASVKIEPRLNVSDARFAAIANGLPFDQTRSAIMINNAIDIQSRGAIGNIFIGGKAQNIEANSDNVNVKGQTEGIIAPIAATGAFGGIGNGIRRIDIGEGLATSGSGATSLSGIYANGSLGLITNVNGGGDLRGDIVAPYIEGIRLGGGASLLDTDIIGTTNAFGAVPNPVAGGLLPVSTGNEEVAVFVVATPPVTDNSLLVGIGDIRITGTGGIINSRVVAPRVGSINIAPSGYGMITSDVESTSSGTMGGGSFGGLGIRYSTYSGGATIADIKATGNGSLLDTRNFSSSVRQSEKNSFDPATGITPNASNDIDLFLGTTAKLTKVEGVTNSGVIQDTTINAARSISSVSAFEFRGVVNAGARPRDKNYPMQIRAGGSIGKVTAGRNINGLRVVTGTLDALSAGRDITAFQLSANQRVKKIYAGRNILGTADFGLSGNGSIDTFQAVGNVRGTVNAPKGIRQILIGGNLGSARDQGGIHSGTDINVLSVAGDILDGSYIRANKNIKSFILGGDLQANATVRAASFGTQKIDGGIFGDIVRG